MLWFLRPTSHANVTIQQLSLLDTDPYSFIIVPYSDQFIKVSVEVL